MTLKQIQSKSKQAALHKARILETGQNFVEVG
jgi:hypothetical protein